jgi:hypothetical protein
MDAVTVDAIPMATGTTFTWTSQRLGAQSTNFLTPNTNTSVADNWTAVVLDQYGGGVSPASTVLEIELCYHVEMQVDPVTNTGLLLAAPRDPPAAPAALAATQHARATMPDTVVGPPSAYSKVVEDHATKAMSAIGTGALDMGLDFLMSMLV